MELDIKFHVLSNNKNVNKNKKLKLKDREEINERWNFNNQGWATILTFL